MLLAITGAVLGRGQGVSHGKMGGKEVFLLFICCLAIVAIVDPKFWAGGDADSAHRPPFPPKYKFPSSHPPPPSFFLSSPQVATRFSNQSVKTSPAKCPSSLCSLDISSVSIHTLFLLCLIFAFCIFPCPHRDHPIFPLFSRPSGGRSSVFALCGRHRTLPTDLARIKHQKNHHQLLFFFSPLASPRSADFSLFSWFS